MCNTELNTFVNLEVRNRYLFELSKHNGTSENHKYWEFKLYVYILYLANFGQCSHQKYNHWLSPKPLLVLCCHNIGENLWHANHLWKLDNKDSIYIFLLTISAVVSLTKVPFSKCWRRILTHLKMLLNKKKSKKDLHYTHLCTFRHRGNWFTWI